MSQLFWLDQDRLNRIKHMLSKLWVQSLTTY